MPLADHLGYISLQEPSPAQVAHTLTVASRQGFNHALVGLTRGSQGLRAGSGGLGAGWVVDHNCVQVGRGKEAYRRAKAALQGWAHFRLGWAYTNQPPVQHGAGVCAVARTLGVWTRNPLQVVYVEEDGRARLPPRPARPAAGASAAAPECTVRGCRFTFAHATLHGHQLAGEERFGVLWNREDDTVWYEILTFSKAANLLAAATYPIVRLQQRRFARGSLAAMQQAVVAP